MNKQYDNLIVAKLLSSQSLGLYALAFTIASLLHRYSCSCVKLFVISRVYQI